MRPRSEFLLPRKLSETPANRNGEGDGSKSRAERAERGWASRRCRAPSGFRRSQTSALLRDLVHASTHRHPHTHTHTLAAAPRPLPAPRAERHLPCGLRGDDAAPTGAVDPGRTGAGRRGRGGRGDGPRPPLALAREEPEQARGAWRGRERSRVDGERGGAGPAAGGRAGPPRGVGFHWQLRPPGAPSRPGRGVLGPVQSLAVGAPGRQPAVPLESCFPSPPTVPEMSAQVALALSSFQEPEVPLLAFRGFGVPRFRHSVDQPGLGRTSVLRQTLATSTGKPFETAILAPALWCRASDLEPL